MFRVVLRLAVTLAWSRPRPTGRAPSLGRAGRAAFLLQALQLCEEQFSVACAVRGKRVLELGAGGGLPGLVCAAAGAAHVVLSDLPEALPRLRRGVRQNDLSKNVAVKALDWRPAILHPLFSDYGVEGRVAAYLGDSLPVSYTHLTLPTKA